MKYPVQSWITNSKGATQQGNLNFGEGAPRIDSYGKRFYWKIRLIVGCCAPAGTNEMQPYE
jgi:hypothetical protein